MSALAEALVAAQAELPTGIGKDANGEATNGNRYRYLTLDKLIAETRPILQRHGLSVLQFPTMAQRDEIGQDGKQLTAYVPALSTALLHESGEKIENTMPLYLSDKSMQALGSAITYARRYAWQSVLGIAAEEDTDAKDEIPF